MKTSLIFFLFIFTIFLAVPVLSFAQEPLIVPLMPGVTEGMGTYFEITDSEYLNISLQSSKEITVLLESIPKTISLRIEASIPANSTALMIGGLRPNTSYYKYTDSYRNEEIVTVNGEGKYTFLQELVSPHHVWFQESGGTIFLPEDCSLYGNWDDLNSTCTLTQDLTQSVEITTDDITLDCDNHSVMGTYYIAYGIYLNNRENITVKNCNVAYFSSGISLRWGSSNNILAANSISNNWAGIQLIESPNNIIMENSVSNNRYGISFIYSSNNTALNNTTLNNSYGIYFGDAFNNTLTGNVIQNDGIVIAGSSIANWNTHSIDTSNTVNGKSVIYWKDRNGGTIPFGAGQVIIANSTNVNVLGQNTNYTTSGIQLGFSNNMFISGNTANHNNRDGIRLYYSSGNIISDNITSFNEDYGIDLAWSSDNNISENTVSSNDDGIFIGGGRSNIISNNTVSSNEGGIILSSSNNNKIYHNNLVDNSVQASDEYGAYNLFDNGYPDGGNYWSDYDTPTEGCNDSNNDGICDIPYTFTGGQDRYPFMEEDGWATPVNQPPTILNLNQYKSDIQTEIIEGGITTESSPSDPTEGIVVLKAFVADPDNDQVKLQVELKEYNQPFDETNLLESNLISSGNEVTVTADNLTNGQYKWRARAVDDKEASSAWQEFGTAGNLDFEVKLVPLYTQVFSQYPSFAETDEWDDLQYGAGNYSDCFNEELGRSTIATCGCAITSAVMLLRYYDITTAIGNKDVNPLNFNDWLNNNSGYTTLGDLDWPKVAEYAISPSTGLTRIHYDGRREFKDTTTLNVYLEAINPVILYNDAFGHFLIADGKLSTTYTVRDPAWYKTRKLDEETTNWVQKVRDYNDNFDGLRLYSPLLAGGPVDGISLNLASPAELLVIDPTGRKLGKDPINDISYNEIPQASYGQEGISNSEIEVPIPYHKTKNIWIPDPVDGEYNIQVIGTETGGYALDVLAYDQNGHPKDITYQASTTSGNIQSFELNYSKENTQETASYRIVNIDIKPGGYPNSINLKSKGLTPIAVLADEFFYAKDIIIDSVIFAGASPKKGKIEDVDNDGDSDLILHFDTQSLQLSPTSTEAILTGQLANVNLIKGTDSVRIAQKAAEQTIFSKLLSYFNQFIQNIVSAIGLAAITK